MSWRIFSVRVTSFAAFYHLSMLRLSFRIGLGIFWIAISYQTYEIHLNWMYLIYFQHIHRPSDIFPLSAASWDALGIWDLLEGSLISVSFRFRLVYTTQRNTFFALEVSFFKNGRQGTSTFHVIAHQHGYTKAIHSPVFIITILICVATALS